MTTALPGSAASWRETRLAAHARWLVPKLGLLALLAALIYPFAALAAKALSSSGAVGRVADIPGISKTLINTFWLALACVVVAMTIGILLAWCASSLRSRALVSAATVMGTIPIMLPNIAAVIGWQFLLSPNVGYANILIRRITGSHAQSGPLNVYSLPMIIMVSSMYLVGFVFLFVSTALRDFDMGMEDAARVFGSTWVGAQFRIVGRSIRPALVYSVVIVFLLALGQFTAPLILGQNANINVITTQIYLSISRFPGDYGAAAVMCLPVLVVAIGLLIVQRRAVGSLARFAAGGKGASRMRKARRWPILPITLFSVVTTAPPLFALIWVALAPYWSGTFSTHGFGFHHFGEVIDDPRVTSAIVNTLHMSVISVVACVAMALLLALLFQRSAGPLPRLLEVVVSLPLTVPAVAMGVAVFFSYGLGPAGLGGNTVIIIAWVIMFIPHALRLIMSGLSQIGPELASAARVSGSGALGAVLRVVAPLLRTSLASAALLVFVLSLNEFAAVVLLREPGSDVLSTQLFQYFESGTYAEVAVMSLIMVVVSAVGVVLVQFAGRRKEWFS